MKKKTSFIITIINSVIILCLLAYIIVVKGSDKDAKAIFNMNINSIVEVKATTDTVGESYGTGVIYDSSGFLITNAHVISYTSLGEIETFDSYEIRFATKDDYQSATLIKYNSEIDLAILKINDESIKYDAVEFANDNYSYGDKVYAIGNTSNYGIGISEGIISVPEVNVKYDNISRLVIQADIDISSGNSGGALLNDKGQLIGITTFRTKDNQGNVNYGFTYSIPLKTIKKIISEG
ncbi:MAG: S1C family serine protease [Anaeroplasmataceae bacterium]